MNKTLPYSLYVHLRGISGDVHFGETRGSGFPLGEISGPLVMLSDAWSDTSELGFRKIFLS